LNEQLSPQLALELLVFALCGLHDLPATFVGAQVQKRSHDMARNNGVGYHTRANVQLSTITVEDSLGSWKALPNGLRDSDSQCGWVCLGPGVDAEASEIAPKRRNAPSMAWPGKDAFIRRDTSGADSEIDEAATGGRRKPHDAGGRELGESGFPP
jgi:hypothetical protein